MMGFFIPWRAKVLLKMTAAGMLCCLLRYGTASTENYGRFLMFGPYIIHRKWGKGELLLL